MSKYNAPSKDGFANGIFDNNISWNDFIDLCMMAKVNVDYEPRGNGKAWEPGHALGYWISRRMDAGLDTGIWKKNQHFTMMDPTNGNKVWVKEDVQDYVNSKFGFGEPKIFDREAFKKKINMLIRDARRRAAIHMAIDTAETEFEANNIVLDAIKKI